MTERDAVFYYTGGNPLGNEKSFLLIWKEQNIKIGSISHETIIEQTETSIKTEMDWRNTTVLIPENLESQRQKILSMVVDAFACHDFLGKKVIFDPAMNYQENKGTGRCL